MANRVLASRAGARTAVLSLVWRADAYLPVAARTLAEFAVVYSGTWRGDA